MIKRTLLLFLICLLTPNLGYSFQVDSLLEELETEIAGFLEDDPQAFRLREAEKLLETTNRNSRWANYITACKIIRGCRSKSAVPLLLKYTISHASTGAGSPDAYANTITLLTGHDIGNFSFGGSAEERKEQIVKKAEDLYRNWWLPNKDELTTDIFRWPRQNLEAHVQRLLKKTIRSSDYLNRDEKMNASRMYNIVTYDLPKLIKRSERSWLEEEAHPCMLPLLLAGAGWDLKTQKAIPGSNTMPPFGMVGLLTFFRENGNADMLDEIASDESNDSGVRLICAFALQFAGEDSVEDVFLSVLENDKRLKMRLAAILALGSYRDVGPKLLKLLKDPNQQIRTAALLAMRNSLIPEALPELEKILYEDPTVASRGNVIELVAAHGGPKATRILGDYLQTQFGKDSERKYRDAVYALSKLAGERWIAAGAHDKEYYRKQAAKAVEWWKKNKEFIKRQAAGKADGIFEKLNDIQEVPDDFLKTYDGFVFAARNGDKTAVQKMVVTGMIEVVRLEEPEDSKENRLDLQFMADDFSADVVRLRFDAENDMLQIETETSKLHWIKLANQGWKLLKFK